MTLAAGKIFVLTEESKIVSNRNSVLKLLAYISTQIISLVLKK